MSRGSSRGAGAGVPASRGGGSSRGRGRGARSDYSTVALDYDAAASPSSPQASSSNVAAPSSSSGFAAAQKTRSLPRARHANGDTGLSRHSGRPSPSFSPASTSGTATPAHHGIGSSSLPAASRNGDKIDFLRPVSFVKASSSLASTIDEPASALGAPAQASSSAHQGGQSSSSTDEPSAGFRNHSLPSPPVASDQYSQATSRSQHLEVIPLPTRIAVLSSHTSEHLDDQSHKSTTVVEAEQHLADNAAEDSVMQGVPNDRLFFVDTGDTAGLAFRTSVEGLEPAPCAVREILPDATSEDSDIASDTEEVYRPRGKSTGRAGNLAGENFNMSSRSYAVVVDDPPAECRSVPPVPGASSEELKLVAQLTRMKPSSTRSSRPSRLVQKKRYRREARERKKLRKRGQLTARLFEEMEIGSDEDVRDRLEDGVDRDLPMEAAHPRLTGKSKKASRARTATDEALQDYLRNIQAHNETDEEVSFLQAHKFDDCSVSDTPSFEAAHLEASSSEFDELEEQILASTADNTGASSGNGTPEVLEETLKIDCEALYVAPRNASHLEQDDGSGSATTASDDDDEEEIEIEDELMALEELLMNGASFTYKAPKSLTKRQSVDSSHFDFDAFDDSLQKQWQKDRAKKALKRQERYLKRLEAQPTKSNRKKAKRAGASQDIWSDFADTFANATVQPDFHRIDSNIRSFVEDTSRAEIALPPMDKKFRYAVHMLADAYSLKSKSRGTGKNRHNVLYRTMHTSVRGANTYKVQRYLATTASWDVRTPSHKRTDVKGPSRTSAAPRNNEGALVGEGADRIASDNIGHQMLAKMGWAAGEQIGRGGGLAEPLAAIVKTNKAGLGSGFIRYSRGIQDDCKMGTSS